MTNPISIWQVADLQGDELEAFFEKASREDLIAWLQWNDRTAVNALPPISKPEAVEMMRRQIQG